MIKKAFLFPGQGSQYPGMGKDIYKRYETAEKTFCEADDILGFSLSKLCFEGEQEELTMTENAQPAILTVSVAMYRILEEKKIQPMVMAGHSLGEISALTCAGAISFEDALKIARIRGKLMQEAVPEGRGLMAAVLTRDYEELRKLCEETSSGGEGIVTVSNYNSRTQHVISGNAEAVKQAVEKLQADGVKTKILNLSAPFHSPLMKPASDRLREVLDQITFREPQCTVLANVTALPYQDASEIRESLLRQMYSPVQWAQSMDYLKKHNISYCAEVGPGHVLTNLMRTNISDIPVFSFDDQEEAFFRHVEKSYFPFVSRAMGIAVATKNRNWDEEQYEDGVVRPYTEMQKMQEQIETEGRKATAEEMNTAVQLLKTIFRTKGTPNEEQEARIAELLADTGEEESFYFPGT